MRVPCVEPVQLTITQYMCVIILFRHFKTFCVLGTAVTQWQRSGLQVDMPDFISLAKVGIGPVYPYNAELWPLTISFVSDKASIQL